MNDSDEYRLLKGEISFLHQKVDKVQNTLQGIVIFSILFLCIAVLFWMYGFNHGQFQIKRTLSSSYIFLYGYIYYQPLLFPSHSPFPFHQLYHLPYLLHWVGQLANHRFNNLLTIGLVNLSQAFFHPFQHCYSS